jgi:hypothetical protein
MARISSRWLASNDSMIGSSRPHASSSSTVPKLVRASGAAVLQAALLRRAGDLDELTGVVHAGTSLLLVMPREGVGRAADRARLAETLYCIIDSQGTNR